MRPALGNWVRAYRQKHAGDEPPLQLSERARLRELERRNRELEMENAFLKKAAAYFAAGASVSEEYEFIDAQYADTPPVAGCSRDHAHVQVAGSIEVRVL